MPKKRSLSVAEIARRGQQLYDRKIRADVETEHAGQFLVVDIRTGDYEIADDDVTAFDRALEKNPNAVLYLVRIGEPAAFRFGGHCGGVANS